jgi:hypothetical protein
MFPTCLPIGTLIVFPPLDEPGSPIASCVIFGAGADRVVASDGLSYYRNVNMQMTRIEKISRSNSDKVAAATFAPRLE